MNRLVSKLPLLFWNLFSVVSVVPRYSQWQVVYSALLMMSCIYNFYMTPIVVCYLEKNLCDNSVSTAIKGLFMRVVAGTCFVSRLTAIVMYKDNKRRLRYIGWVRNTDGPDTKEVNRMSLMLASCCLLLTLPVNFLRLWPLFFKPNFTLINLIFMYVQNASTYWVETHFGILCFVLWREFLAINTDLTSLKVRYSGEHISRAVFMLKCFNEIFKNVFL